MNGRAGFVLDLHRCTGCAACVVACRLEHGWPASAPWRRVVPLNLSRRAAGPTYFLSLACHHCENAACAKACPSGAYEQQEDGTVVHHQRLCLGCRYCEMACPFGAPHYDEGRGVVTKCNYCEDRVASGELPACVSACPTGALRPLAEAGPDASACVPGFADPAHVRPSIRFKRPRGIRGGRLRYMEGSRRNVD